MRDPNFIDNGDFLNIILNDDLFMNDDEMLIDECVSFMLGGT
jgi:hypothetical protein